MSTFRLPAPEHLDVLAEVMASIHPDLARNDVTVGLIVAHAKCDKDGEPTGPALKLHGVACFATIRVTKLCERIKGLEDVQVRVDGDVWMTHTPEMRRAILDHELEHLIILADEKTGIVETDDANRPKLKLRGHDWDGGFFYSCVERHGADAIESIQYGNLRRAMMKMQS